MLEAKNLYDKEFAQCQGSFGEVPWSSESMIAAVKTCPSCRSHLVYLAEDSSTEQTDLEARCRQCGAEIAAGRLVEASLNDYYGADLYAAAADGDVPPLGPCRACGYERYSWGEGWPTSATSTRCSEAKEMLEARIES